MSVIKLKDILRESAEVTFASPDDVEYDFSQDLARIEKESGIAILRGKELFTVALQEGRVVGALYIENDGQEFSFDVIVDKAARGQGIGAKLIDMALSEASQMESEMGIQLKVDVVNPWVEKYLAHKGLKVLQKVQGHTLMVR